MARIDDVPEEPDLGLAAIYKEFRDSPTHQDRLKREEKQAEWQEREKEREIEQKREIERVAKSEIVRQSERRNDRWFAAKMLIIGASLGALVTKMLDLIFK